ncbi:hypothetical protein DKL51_03405 [Micromonospora globispora]|nr:hypothetical protein DKL51_03405 [Micromonospora globispora]
MRRAADQQQSLPPSHSQPVRDSTATTTTTAASTSGPATGRAPRTRSSRRGTARPQRAKPEAYGRKASPAASAGWC